MTYIPSEPNVLRVAHAVQPLNPMETALQMFKHRQLDSESVLIETGAVSKESFGSILEELDRWPVENGGFYALSRQVQVSGERPG